MLDEIGRINQGVAIQAEVKVCVRGGKNVSSTWRCSRDHDHGGLLQPASGRCRYSLARLEVNVTIEERAIAACDDIVRFKLTQPHCPMNAVAMLIIQTTIVLS